MGDSGGQQGGGCYLQQGMDAHHLTVLQAMVAVVDPKCDAHMRAIQMSVILPDELLSSLNRLIDEVKILERVRGSVRAPPRSAGSSKVSALDAGESGDAIDALL